jgi:putative ABC transport system permease protein
VIALAFRLGLTVSFGVAAVRMAVQLAAVGFVLKFIFEQTSPLWTLLVALVMVLVAGYELVQRQERRLRGWLAYGLGNATLLLVGGVATLYAVVVVVHPSPWYAPRYIVPILGMVLGNTLTSVSLALQTLTESAERDRAAIEARIALGATRFEAFAIVLRRAMRVAITPLLNMMSVAGIVSLPGMMTGQILAGADPAEAAKYQIMIMFVLAGAGALGALAAAFGGVLMLTDSRHRLRLDRLATAQV